MNLSLYEFGQTKYEDKMIHEFKNVREIIITNKNISFINSTGQNIEANLRNKQCIIIRDIRE